MNGGPREIPKAKPEGPHCHQTQPALRECHTQYYIVEVHILVELNPNILVQHVERMIFRVCRKAVLRNFRL